MSADARKGRSFGAASRSARGCAPRAAQRVDEAFVARGRYAAMDLDEIALLIGVPDRRWVYPILRRALRKIVACARAHPDEFPRLAQMAGNQRERVRSRDAADRQASSQGAGRARRAARSSAHTGCVNTPDLSPRSLTTPGAASAPGASPPTGREGKR